MTGALQAPAPGVCTVVVDANVLYSRSLRDYLLIASERGIVRVHWSPQILRDVVDKLIKNRPTFNVESGERLVAALTSAFPSAMLAPKPDHIARVARFEVPDDDDRDVMATALTAGATVICTLNRRDFPKRVMDGLGLTVMSPDGLFGKLMDDYLPQMISVHRQTVAHFRGATDWSTLEALRKARAPQTARRMAAALGLNRS